METKTLEVLNILEELENVEEIEKAEYDSPWKNVLNHFLPEFMEFCLPEAHAQIDWSRPYISLDKKLTAMRYDQEVGKRVVDLLF